MKSEIQRERNVWKIDKMLNKKPKKESARKKINV